MTSTRCIAGNNDDGVFNCLGMSFRWQYGIILTPTWRRRFVVKWVHASKQTKRGRTLGEVAWTKSTPNVINDTRISIVKPICYFPSGKVDENIGR